MDFAYNQLFLSRFQICENQCCQIELSQIELTSLQEYQEHTYALLRLIERIIEFAHIRLTVRYTKKYYFYFRLHKVFDPPQNNHRINILILFLILWKMNT